MSKFNKKTSVGIVLAGGRSTRYGNPKALETLAGIPFYQKAISVLSPFVDHTVIVAHPTIEEKIDRGKHMSIINDLPPFEEQGPLAGIYSVMSTYPATHYLVLACDMPLMKREIFEYMLSELNSNLKSDDSVVPIVENRVQPLTAIYSGSVKTIIHQLLLDQKRRFTDLYDLIDPAYLQITSREWIPCFDNINTPEDYHHIQKRDCPKSHES